jgi:hypothetical protein
VCAAVWREGLRDDEAVEFFHRRQIPDFLDANTPNDYTKKGIELYSTGAEVRGRLAAKKLTNNPSNEYTQLQKILK